MSFAFSVAGILAAPFLGGLLAGLDRKITARLQGRKGPPIIQPFYDVIKLFGKESTYTNRHQVFYIYAYLLWMAMALLLLLTLQDFLVFVFALTFAEISLALAGFSTRSPYSHIGSNREILQILASEPVLVFLAFALYLASGSFMAGGLFLLGEPLLRNFPLIFAAVLLILTIKMRKSPFDLSSSAHAHQEIVRGVTTEFSGRYLALSEIAHWVELVIILFVVFLFWVDPWWVGILLALAAYLAEIVIDNIFARLKISWMVATAWGWGFGLSLLNILYFTM
ncbi:MAG: NADH-quinone oxidoreductase subunit H [Syntrophomonadaceae bacterium]|nr:NADH-quinone oxidoreductase subunit H [Syntrophomonadaceae bacterium]